MTAGESRMAREAREAADGARRQIATCAAALAELGARLRASPPAFVVTCARGSSDHAATYGKYVLETTVGRLVASVGPSVASTYGRAPIGLERALVIAVSQSGRSPDVLRLTETARAAGAVVVGLINDTTAPLEESLGAVESLRRHEDVFAIALDQPPAALAADEIADVVTEHGGEERDEPDEPDVEVAGATSMYVVGRGVGLGAAAELALKLKETCRLHAEAFSTAEVVHGPIALVGAGFPILALGQDDETAAGTRTAVAHLHALGADVRSALTVAGTTALPTVAGVAPIIAPLCQVQSFYLAVPALAAARGLDPDAPPNLRKITETV